MTKPRSSVATLTIVALLAAPAGPAFGGQSAPGAAAQAPSATAPVNASTVTKPVPSPDGVWPRAYKTATGGKVLLYLPQVGPWPDQKHMTMFAAVAYQAQGAAKPSLGTLKIEADTQVALADRLVSFSDFKITQANFESVPKDQLQGVVEDINNAIPREDRVLALDRVLAMVETSLVQPKNIEGVKATAPPIYYSERPAVLVNFDSDPIWSPIKENELQFAVNTNWDVFEYTPASAPAKKFFLRVNDSWLAADSVNGPWKPAGKLPASFTNLPANGNWTDVKAALPGQPLAAAAVPTVFVSTMPAELILLNGPAQYTPVPGTELMWVSNTDSDVFRMGRDGPVYFLVAGRWFSAANFNGPTWTFVTPTLPDDFKKIPLEHPRSRVLASVPGTRPAIEAVLLAQIPQTARVNRKEIQAPDVEYAGDPNFEPIPKTTVARAVNTDKEVIQAGDMYYLCFQGVWFQSASATGPWVVADSIPKAIYEIPISSPAYNVTYVTVEDSDDEWVDYAAAAAYTGLMVGWGCAMWGSGWYYPPYYYGGAYFGHWATYGYGARYNPWTGAYTRGAGIYGPYGGAGFASRYNPRTGTYSRGAFAYGPGGAVGRASAWNPRTGTAAATRQGANVYGSWGSTAVRRGDQWASTQRYTNRATGTTTRTTQGSGGGGAITRNPAGLGNASGVVKGANGDVYAGRDGSVYRNQGGTWQKADGTGGWSSVDRPSGRSDTSGFDRATTMDQLNRDYASRTDGWQRTQDLGSYRGSGGGSWGSAGSYRPSGGMHGGGGMRMGGGGGGMRGGGRR